jgi:CDGSH-type Zn-finger protein
MAEHKTEERNGHLRTEITLEPGERVALCRCFKSGNFPFCDGTHKTLPENVGPAIVAGAGKKEELKSDKIPT